MSGEWIDGSEQLPDEGIFVWLIKEGFPYSNGGNSRVYKYFLPVRAYYQRGIWFEEYEHINGGRVVEAIDTAKLPGVWWCPTDQDMPPIPEHIYN